uniref:Very long chain fatty acid elongase n=1 Tax=Phenacoccus solenopsis TaxID=483260 RepID=A0A482E8G3_9HEMI|nr:very long chain fatty acid elongase [Phenacoccus solenopsis]
MPPNNTENVIMNEEKGEYPELNFLEVSGFASKTKNDESKTKESKRQPIIWTNVILISLFHVTAVYMFFAYVYYIKLITITWGFIVGGIGGFGITAGAHRLWSHRSYKAKLPLQLILVFAYSVAGQNSIFDWVRDHRVHHKFSETDADPHNSKRGFFFSHVGWLMQRKHPEVLRKGKLVDMSDITNDPLLAFHTKYFIYFKLLCCFILPVLVPVYCWGETWKYAIASQVFVRYVLNLNFTWSVNSVAHIWGRKPYDKRIMPAENIGVAIVAMGEGWHNYHHVFPWDYKAAELGDYKFNITTMWLDLFAKIGWAYDMKTPSKELVQKTMEKYGDKSHIDEVPYDRVHEEKSK